MSLRMIILGLVLLICSVCFGQDELTLESVVQRLDAVIAQSDGPESKAEVLAAAAGLGFVLERDGIESAEGHLTLGNAYLVGDDLGRAIVEFRRGLLIDPADDVLLENLEYARSFVEPRVPGEDSGWGISAALLSWRGVVSRWTMWIGSVVCVGIASCMLTAGCFGVRVPKIGVAIAGVIGVAGFGLLGFDWWTTASIDDVVIVDGGVMLYSGPGAGVYSEIYDKPLGIGTEAQLVESRDGWSNIQLRNDSGGWIENESFISIVNR